MHACVCVRVWGRDSDADQLTSNFQLENKCVFQCTEAVNVSMTKQRCLKGWMALASWVSHMLQRIAATVFFSERHRTHFTFEFPVTSQLSSVMAQNLTSLLILEQAFLLLKSIEASAFPPAHTQCLFSDRYCNWHWAYNLESNGWVLFLLEADRVLGQTRNKLNKNFR